MSDENTLTGSETPETTPGESASEAKAPEAKAEETAAQEAEKPEGEAEKESSGDDESTPEKPKPKSRARERIETLAREKRNLARRLARANQEIGKLRATAPPKEDDYPDPGQYQAETFKRAARESALESQAESANEELQELQSKRAEAWSEIVAEARQNIPDFETVFDATVPVSEAMAELIMESDAPEQVAYWLGKNRGEARRIAEMSPVEAARAIGRLEQRLTAPKPKVVSSAPKPVSTVAGKASAPQPKDLNSLANTKGEDATAVIEEMRRRSASGR